MCRFGRVGIKRLTTARFTGILVLYLFGTLLSALLQKERPMMFRIVSIILSFFIFASTPIPNPKRIQHIYLSPTSSVSNQITKNKLFQDSDVIEKIHLTAFEFENRYLAAMSEGIYLLYTAFKEENALSHSEALELVSTVVQSWTHGTIIRSQYLQLVLDVLPQLKVSFTPSDLVELLKNDLGEKGIYLHRKVFSSQKLTERPDQIDGKESALPVGYLGLGRMGGPLSSQLARNGFKVIAFDLNEEARNKLSSLGAVPAVSQEQVIHLLDQTSSKRRLIWVMVPNQPILNKVLFGQEKVPEIGRRLDQGIQQYLKEGDVVVDGGNNDYQETIKRNRWFQEKGILFVDAGTSGGEEGATLGAAFTVGGSQNALRFIQPHLEQMAVKGGVGLLPHSGYGHLAKTIHNYMEYGYMKIIGDTLQSMVLYLVNEKKLTLDEAFEMLGPIVHYWNEHTLLNSYLLELTEQLVHSRDYFMQIAPTIGGGQTGTWGEREADKRGISVPALKASLEDRFASRRMDRSSWKQLKYFNFRVVAALRDLFGGHGFHHIETGEFKAPGNNREVLPVHTDILSKKYQSFDAEFPFAWSQMAFLSRIKILKIIKNVSLPEVREKMKTANRSLNNLSKLLSVSNEYLLGYLNPTEIKILSAGKRYQYFRLSRGLSYIGLSKLSGIDKLTLSNTEKGRRPPSKSTMYKLAKGFGISIEELCGEAREVYEKRALEAGALERWLYLNGYNTRDLRQLGITLYTVLDFDKGEKIRLATLNRFSQKLGLSLKGLLEGRVETEDPAPESLHSEFSKLKTIGERIIFLRRLKGWTYTKLGAETHIAVANMKQIENNPDYKISKRYLFKLAEALGVTTDYLLGKEDKNNLKETTFSGRLRISRNKKGFSKAELSKRADIAYQTYLKIENGEVKPDVETLSKLARILEVAPGYLLTGQKRELDYQKLPASKLKEISCNVVRLSKSTDPSSLSGTLGHYHEGNHIELHEVLQGEAIYLLRKYGSDFNYWFRLGKGDSILIPSGYYHLTLNPSFHQELVVSNWTIGNGRAVYPKKIKNRFGISELKLKKYENIESFLSVLFSLPGSISGEDILLYTKLVETFDYPILEDLLKQFSLLNNATADSV